MSLLANIMCLPSPAVEWIVVVCGSVGEGGKAREHKTSLHAIRSIMRNEGFIGMYTG